MISANKLIHADSEVFRQIREEKNNMATINGALAIPQCIYT